MSVDSQRSESWPQADQQTNNEPKKQGPEDGGQLGHAGRKEREALPMRFPSSVLPFGGQLRYGGRKELEALPSAKSAATSLVLRTEVLLESLFSWSDGDLTKADVDDAYVQMGDRLDIVIAILHKVGIDTSEVASVFSQLLPAMDELLAGEPVPESLDEPMPRIRTILVELFEPLRDKLREYQNKAPRFPDNSPQTALDDTVQLKPPSRPNNEPPSRYDTRAKRHGRVAPRPAPRNPPSRSQPSVAISIDHTISHPEKSSELNDSAKQTRATRSGGVSEQSEGGSRPVPSVQTSVTRLLISTKQLLESLTQWSKRELTEEDVSDVYVRMVNDFHPAMAVFRASGIDTSDLMTVPDDLRIVLEQGLAEEATPENLDIYLPEIRAILKRLLQGLRVRQTAHEAQNSYSSRISSRQPEEHSSPRRLDHTTRLGAGDGTATTPPGANSALVKEDASSTDAAPALDPPSENPPEASDEHAATRSQVELEPRPASQSAYKPNDPSGSSPRNENSPTQPDETLPSIGPSTITPNESKITDPMVITRNMSTFEILEHLCRHGCNDVSGQLDTSKSSEYPVSSGGYGDVYRGAFCDGNEVALKCLRLPLNEAGISQKQLRRAAQEIYVWSKCIHPNILGLTGVTQYRDQLTMVSPWMPYGSLRRLLSREPGIDRYNLCAQIVDGIAYLHQAGVVHGDLKGDNILFSEDLTPKLADFGNATLKEYTLQFSRTTGRVGMSLNWVAPEVLKDETGLTPEGDIWSLGMTMQEVMTGEPPYAGIRKFSVMRRIESRMLPIRPEAHVPSQKRYADLIWSLFKECWTYDPLQRPSAVEVQHKMKDVVSERDLERSNSGAQQQL